MPHDRAEYRLSPEAERDLEAIWLYTLEEWGLGQADRYADQLMKAFAELAKRPRLGGACDHIRKGYRCFRTGRHAIYYRIAGYGVAVIRVLHDRRLAHGIFDQATEVAPPIRNAAAPSWTETLSPRKTSSALYSNDLHKP